MNFCSLWTAVESRCKCHTLVGVWFILKVLKSTGILFLLFSLENSSVGVVFFLFVNIIVEIIFHRKTSHCYYDILGKEHSCYLPFGRTHFKHCRYMKILQLAFLLLIIHFSLCQSDSLFAEKHLAVQHACRIPCTVIDL